MGVAIGGDHVREADVPRRLGGSLADRKQRQLKQGSLDRLVLYRAQRIGGGDDHRAVMRLRVVGMVVLHDHLLEAQHRRRQDVEPAGPQRACGAVIVGLRAGDENGHAATLSDRSAEEVKELRRLHRATQQCYAGAAKARSGGLCKD